MKRYNILGMQLEQDPEGSWVPFSEVVELQFERDQFNTIAQDRVNAAATLYEQKERLRDLLQVAETAERTGFTKPAWWLSRTQDALRGYHAPETAPDSADAALESAARLFGVPVSRLLAH